MSKNNNRIKETFSDRVTTVVFYIVLTIIGILAFYPILFVISASISSPTSVNAGDVMLWPIDIQFEGYRLIFRNEWILLGYLNSIIYTFFGTLLNLFVTFTAAYALSRKDMFGNKFLSIYALIPMWFGGGLIPTFIVVSGIGLTNSRLTLIVLGAISVYNCIICRTFIQSSIPSELQESARIDGCSDIGIMIKVVLPLSTPVLAILTLYYSLGHWNDYFNALIYMSTRELLPLQIFLREILILNAQFDIRDAASLEASVERARLLQVMRYGLIVVSSIPMLILYPFVQRYFVQGVMIGALKG